jgi:PhnB protein
MKPLNFPKDHQQVMPYLVVENAAGFMAFMQTVFNAEKKMSFSADGKKIAHAEVTIGRQVIMFADPTDELKPQTGGAFIYVADADAVYTKAIANGAMPAIPIKDNPYGRSGGFTDPFGNTWWVKTYRPTI